MDKSYDPERIEAFWRQRWEESGAFAPDAEGEPFCIMIPPPNVTGTLHMGHAFQDTLMDILTRWRRMQSRAALWQPGTDHAGIATQMVVERKLEREGRTRRELGRDAFIEEVWTWKRESGGHITRQLRRMGASVDWSRERFTMDEGLSEAVREVFVQLHEQDLVYRGKRLVNWDPVLRTALSDLEVVASEEQGYLWHLRYPIVDSDEALVVATTRPETMLGDTAVAVHPDDPRYREWIGKSVRLPLAGRDIPILADDYVDPEFGSGCVKITPAHDFNDYQVGLRHDLPLVNIFTDTAHLGEGAPEAYRGLSREQAREQILNDLEAQGLLERTEEHALTIPRGDRSGAVVEPYLTDQWYVRAGPLAEKALAAVRDGRIRFVPENWSKTYYDWMENIEDWCISRQLWWGHRIPAWYDADGTPHVGRDEQEVREKYGIPADAPLRQDEDVLDTWFSSALWPFSTLGWPRKGAALERFYPTDVLVTGFDIIFFWVARMIMMGLHFMEDVPFRDVYVHGLVRDAHGQKMSKSKGNTIDPIDVIDGIDLEALVKKRVEDLMDPKQAGSIERVTRQEFPDGFQACGADALRFCFATQATFGRDVRFELPRVLGYRNFCNKLWNAVRFALIHAERLDGSEPSAEASLVDRWITARAQAVTRSATEHLDAYRFDLAAKTLYDFVWHDFCDWYLEFTKATLNEEAPEDAVQSTLHTLYTTLDGILRLLHPFMPFITEELHQQLPQRQNDTDTFLMTHSWPETEDSKEDSETLETMRWLQEFIGGIRRTRAEMDIAPGRPVPVLLENWTSQDQQRFEAAEAWIRNLARPESVHWMEPGETAPEAATVLIGGMRLLIPLAGLIDRETELARLDRELKKLDGALGAVRGKLENEKFVSRAPEEVVQKERERLAELEATQAQLAEQRERIARTGSQNQTAS
ncbi:MAG: valine--tRNA ligase [Gammaproteobacteria bacterium]|nr:valine--tRNA ligase [Gammaproteobacteria bacterium]